MSTRPRIYLDHAATTPILPAAREAMIGAMERWANPSSPHAEGRAARAALEDARERIKRALEWDGELIFTSGATEAIEIAMQSARANTRMVSAVEHLAVLRSAPDAFRIPVSSDGAVRLDVLAEEVGRAEGPLVAIQSVNSETGAVQPLEEIAPLVRKAGGLLLADCAQSAGKFRLPDADIITISAHKFGGPPGIGALLVRSFDRLDAQGGQEQGYRPGTENLPAVVGFAAALESIERNEVGIVEWIARLWSPPFDNNDLIDAILDEGGYVAAFEGAGSGLIYSIIMPGVSAQAQLIDFDMAGISVSAGSACSSGSLKPSHVLEALGLPPEQANCAIRVSFGWTTTNADLEQFFAAWRRLFHRTGKRAA